MGWLDDLKKGADTFFSGGYNKEIEKGIVDTANTVATAITECKTTNQGSTMDDIRGEIVKINNVTKDILAKARDEIANYYTDWPLLNLVIENNNAEYNYQQLIKYNDKLKNTNDATEQKYIKEQNKLSDEVIALIKKINSLVSELNGLTSDVNYLEKNEILPRISQIEQQYATIKNNVNKNDQAAMNSDKSKTDIQRASFSIAYLEYLLMDAYKRIYRSIYYENVSAGNGIKPRFDVNVNQISINNYQNDRIQFYKNINTFLFYFYYAMIIALVIVVLKFNSTSILIKLTFFRVFAIILILYPLFIIQFQNFIFKLIKYFTPLNI